VISSRAAAQTEVLAVLLPAVLGSCTPRAALPVLPAPVNQAITTLQKPARKLCCMTDIQSFKHPAILQSKHDCYITI